MKINENRNEWMISILLLLFVVLTWVLGNHYIDNNIISDSPGISNIESRGLYGDKFGAINALFSGLAFAGIIFTIYLQRKELVLQRQELADTREELRISATAQENSEQALKRQAENLKISAKLAGLNSLINYYKEEDLKLKIGYTEQHVKRVQINSKIKKYISEIEHIVNEKIIG